VTERSRPDPSDRPRPAGGRGIALVLASSTGGIGRHVASLVGGLVAGGDVVSVFGPAAAAAHFGFADLGADVTPVEIPAKPQLADAVAVRSLRRALQAAAPQVVHAHGLRAGLVAALVRPRPGPLVVTWHNAVLAGGLRAAVYGRLEGFVARSADVTLGASADLVHRATLLGARDVRLSPVAAPTLPPPHRSPAEVREDLGVSADQPLILSVGRLHPQKRYDLLIKAAARWTDRTPPPAVAIAGTGPAYLELAARISAARAPVVLLGHRSDIPDLLAAADLAVVTSDWEARQLFAQEAMAAGVPLIATAVGGLPDLVGDGAILVPPGRVDALDEAVRTLLDDPDLRREYAQRGLRRADTWPTEADTLAAVSAVYDELIASRSTTAGRTPGGT
jgi:glycosyltransferase involved in cell wall biosynthesis